jgi:hypothetical protein
MKKLILLMLVAAFFAVPVSAYAAAVTQTVPFETLVTACNGDTIKISGPLLTVSNVTSTPSGGFVVTIQSVPQGVSGIDLQTGTTYRATGLTRETLVFSPAGGFTQTFVNRFHIQATAGAESDVVSQTFHVTVNANGAFTAVVDHVSVSC